MYGNIGARDRLSGGQRGVPPRGLCSTLGVPVMMSEAFVAAARPDAAVELGEQRLRGVDTPVRVFTLRT